MSEALRTVRCHACGLMLFKAQGLARVEIVCRRCRELRTISVATACAVTGR